MAKDYDPRKVGRVNSNTVDHTKNTVTKKVEFAGVCSECLVTNKAMVKVTFNAGEGINQGDVAANCGQCNSALILEANW